MKLAPYNEIGPLPVNYLSLTIFLQRSHNGSPYSLLVIHPELKNMVVLTIV
jgi:hypothetical protein